MSPAFHQEVVKGGRIYGVARESLQVGQLGRRQGDLPGREGGESYGETPRCEGGSEGTVRSVSLLTTVESRRWQEALG